MHLHLVIGNKAYSSWSLRPWILLRHFGIPFDETVIAMYRPDTHAAMLRFGPTGKVPVLEADGITVHESLAILDFVAEAFPHLPIWPEDRRARALARSLCSEMHAGFSKLRQACPTNFRREPRPIVIDAEVEADIARLEEAWSGARALFGGRGPFLFGAFSAADAMFAPVVNRLHVYAVTVKPETRAYMDAIMALPAWQDWIADAKAEPWVNPDYETM